MELQQRQLLIGFPDTGKTTFLAALWHVVQSKQVSDSLITHNLDGDYTYLNKTRDSWLRFESLSRTELRSDEEVCLSLTDPKTGKVAELIVPDTKGEAFNTQWEERSCTKKFYAFAKESAGVLLFINPDRFIEPQWITPQVQDMTRSLRENPTEDNAQSETQRKLLPKWTPESAADAVKIVDILQFVSNDPFDGRQVKLALIISAWDVVGHDYKKPQDWLQMRAPLLHQFLTSNRDRFDYQMFGVSAQGGDYKNVEALLVHERISDRIRVVDERGRVSCNITLPIQWILGESE